jgi:hypothetical protein
VHDTTKQKPIEMFKQEKPLLEPFYKSVKEDTVVDDVHKTRLNSSQLEIDITYHTTISDYEKILGATYASA